MALISVIIPSRNETHLTHTVESILQNVAGEVEVLVLLDGWDLKPTPKVDEALVGRFHRQIEGIREMADKDQRIRILHKEKSVGQRVFINEAAARMKGEFMLKIDAHCQISKNWDRELLKVGSPEVFVTTRMCSFDQENWTRGQRKFDFCFLNNHLATLWWMEYGQRVRHEIISETMSFYGTVWFVHQDFWNKHGGYENLYGWGDSGTEWALKTWLCGDRLLVHRGVTVAHQYREKFPYPITGGPRLATARQIRGMFYQNQYKLQIHPIEWLVGKFWPVPTWERTLVTDAHREGAYFKK